MKTKTKRPLLLLVLMIFATSINAQQPDTAQPTKHEFSVQQAVDYALKNNVNVKNALLQVKVQEQQNAVFTAAAYPHINASIGTTYNPAIATTVIPNFISPATYQVLIDQGVKDGNGNPIQMPSNFGLIPAKFGTKFSANAGISLQQILFDGQVFVGLLARGAAVALQQKGAEVTQETLKANIYKVYYQLAVSKTQIEMLDANIALVEKNLRDTRIIYENGFREKLDVDKETVRLSNLKTEKQKLLNQISNGYYALKMLMGMPISDELILTDNITEQDVKDGVLNASGYTYADRKEFQQAEISKKLLEYNVRRFKLSQIPTISLSALYAKNAQRDKWNFIGKGDWFTVSNVNLNVTIPIFNGFFTRSKIKEAQLEVNKISNQLDALKLWIDNDVEAAKNNYRNALATMDMQKQNKELAEKVYQQTKKKYEVGTGTQIEIVAAQTEMKSAQTNYISALYDAIIAKVDYLKATGKL
ncbi:MAG TPA: TolC family protein [Chitinophagaceae bacterium]|jgi:outer membrane protein TolC|nr:TolC family protein [Chitinophagaceae bacterium]HNO55973.1 TolC family protein [Chitinophagaceae bacterium]